MATVAIKPVPHRTWPAGGLLSAVALATSLGVIAAENPATVDSAPARARAVFEQNCALCHGIDARGNGPFAELLKVAPPDLTTLARTAGGTFPFSRVYRAIDGRDRLHAHGTADMPIWGERWVREGGDETYARGRIFEIMLYLESIQQP